MKAIVIRTIYFNATANNIISLETQFQLSYFGSKPIYRYTYQPLRTSWMWHKVNFLNGVERAWIQFSIC